MKDKPIMTTLTIYTNDYDKDENVANGGMSGKVFLDMDNQFGKECKSLDDALDYSFKNNININMIEFNYVDDEGIQMFKKFPIQ